jgi:hypothetical protein
MNKQRSPKPGCLRILRRILRFALIIVGVAVLIGLVGVVGLWGHLWEFRVGDPSADTCGNCHVLEQYVATQDDPDLLINRHFVRDIDCLDCHAFDFERQAHETLAYLRDDYDQPFMRVQYGMETCFQCHEHGSYDQIAWRTTDLGVTDAQAGGHDANPHQPPHYTELECHSCHRMHRPSTLLCSECHIYQFRFPLMSQKEQ